MPCSALRSPGVVRRRARTARGSPMPTCTTTRRGGWLAGAVAAAGREADVVLVTPHWGPNMTVRPRRTSAAAARALLSAGATLVAGHSAHVVHGAAARCSTTWATWSTTTWSTAAAQRPRPAVPGRSRPGRPAARRGGPAQARLLPDAAGAGRGGGLDPAALRGSVCGARDRGRRARRPRGGQLVRVSSARARTRRPGAAGEASRRLKPGRSSATRSASAKRRRRRVEGMAASCRSHHRLDKGRPPSVGAVDRSG